MRGIAAAVGCAGTLCLKLIWMLVFAWSPDFLFIWVQLYIASFFLFGVLGAHWLGKYIWYVLIGAFLLSYVLYLSEAADATVLLYGTALKDSLLIVGSMLFGNGVYKLLFNKITSK